MSAKLIRMTVSVRMNVALSVDAYRDEGGEVRFETVRNFVGLPDEREIFESMEEEEFDALEEDFVAAGGDE